MSTKNVFRLNKVYGFIPYNNFECSIDWYQTEPK